ncbi:MAG: electron transfer flavoprotein subunit beta/FixA family protein [Acidobacteria bacterium]|nr:electron transfer flavoprotein subunit beta/FixA family protein [Acidobacteriota bacterium]
MNILVCVKRVPDTGARVEITANGRAIETRNLGFTISPHEECAVEEAAVIAEKLGGSCTVLTVGPKDAEDQLRDCLAKGMDRGVLIETDGNELDPGQTASAIVGFVRAQRAPFDLILFGSESADAANYQIGIHVAYALDLPCVTGVKRMSVQTGSVTAKQETRTGFDVYQAQLPAVLTVKEGLNLPRHPSLKATMGARKKPVERMRAEVGPASLEMVRLSVPAEKGSGAEILGEGKSAVPRIVDLLEELRLI